MTNVAKGLERRAIDDIKMETAASIITTFSELVRESGSEDEKKAAHYLETFLKEWQVPYTIHEPTIYLSVPKTASIRMISPNVKEIKAKAPSASAS
jgi:N-acetylated-alpha-linked acidic dipeptidase